MKARRAKFADIPDIMRLCEAARAASKYANFANIREDEFKEVLLNVIGRDGSTAPGSAHVSVAVDQNDRVHGLIVAINTWLYEALDVRLVTDLIFFVAPGAPSTSAKVLIDGVSAWAESLPGRVVQRHGVTDAISDPEKTGRFIRRAGLVKCGTIYERTIQ